MLPLWAAGLGSLIKSAVSAFRHPWGCSHQSVETKSTATGCIKLIWITLLVFDSSSDSSFDNAYFWQLLKEYFQWLGREILCERNTSRPNWTRQKIIYVLCFVTKRTASQSGEWLWAADSNVENPVWFHTPPHAAAGWLDFSSSPHPCLIGQLATSYLTRPLKPN